MRVKHRFDIVLNIEYETNSKGDIISYAVIEKRIKVKQ